MVDEWQKDRFARELEEVRGQIRGVRSELNRLEAERTHRPTTEPDPTLESNIQTQQSRLFELRARHDELANLVEGKVDAPTTPSLYDHIVTFVGDYKWIIAGLIAMGGLVGGAAYLSTNPLNSEEEKAQIRRGMGLPSAEEAARAQQMMSAAYGRQGQVMRQMNQMRQEERASKQPWPPAVATPSAGDAPTTATVELAPTPRP